ncbi:protein claret segregational [Topomyia yanbarensis]|uniref:protein claret segregational n=1 Tax=Topomyia yanbarensis TaxID=2498891 RepID=UPI00273ADC2C|nr:protein claret segregational [Topomyia yanbarensis]XP_058822176.1 protein claret segregational [Topomyia yanbarensis]
MESKIPKPMFVKKPTGMASLPGNARLPLTDLLNVPLELDYNGKRVASPELVRVATINKTKMRRSRSAIDLSRPNFHRPKFVPNLESIPSTKLHINSATVSQMVKNNLVKQVQKPSQLRRSLSTGDLTTKPLPTCNINSSVQQTHIKRQLSTISSTLPAKATKVTATSTATGKVYGAKPTTSNTATVKKLPMTNKPKVGLAKSSAINSSVSSEKSTVSNGGAGKKNIRQRIPPYDYKARFNDLLEKHQLLKTKLDKLTEANSELESLPQKYDDCLNELNKLKKEHERLQEKHRSALCENENLKLKNASLSSNLSETEAELSSLKKQYTMADDERTKLREMVKSLQEKSSLLEERNEFLQHDNNKKSELLFKANIERKDLHNAVMDLRGNIRVFCRVRPPLASELDRLECVWKYLDEQSLEISASDGCSKRMEFSFDHVFHSRTAQQDIFENVAPLIQSALDGYNVCIFAYGQTGSGKTYTMDGVPDELGVIPRTVDLIFNSVEDYKRLGWKYEIRVNFLEIYNEILYDLLDSSGTTKDLEIRMANAKNKTEVYVSNVIEETVQSKNQLRQLMATAKSNRATAATVGNERSSRSHAVTKLQLIGTHEEKGELSVGSINLVDLAGSESPKTSTRMDETKNINRSLSELSNVILALVQKNEHIPYRNSKLTHLLMPSLGGNSKTLMFVNVSPFQDCFNETIKSLRFASQVNACKLQKVRKNKILNNSSMF